MKEALTVRGFPKAYGDFTLLVDIPKINFATGSDILDLLLPTEDFPPWWGPAAWEISRWAGVVCSEKDISDTPSAHKDFLPNTVDLIAY